MLADRESKEQNRARYGTFVADREYAMNFLWTMEGDAQLCNLVILIQPLLLTYVR